MGDIIVYLAIAILAALAVYCCWHGVKALRTGVVNSPTMLSPGNTKRADSPISFWIQTLFWLVASGVIGYNIARWLAAVAEA